MPATPGKPDQPGTAQRPGQQPQGTHPVFVPRELGQRLTRHENLIPLPDLHDLAGVTLAQQRHMVAPVQAAGVGRTLRHMGKALRPAGIAVHIEHHRTEAGLLGGGERIVEDHGPPDIGIHHAGAVEAPEQQNEDRRDGQHDHPHPAQQRPLHERGFSDERDQSSERHERAS